MSLHTLQRPSWLCAVCGAPWPCQTSRRELLAEYDGSPDALRLHLTLLQTEARHALGLSFDAAYERFLGWADDAAAEGRPRFTGRARPR